MQVEQPLFTVATISYNSGKWIRQTIESILASTYNNFEFIISDDCSTDDTWEIVQHYKDPRIRSWRNEINLGEYPNRNKVLHAAKGKYIIYIDGDDILYKDSLDTFNRYLKAFPNAKAVWGVYPVFFDFVVMPYLFNPEQLTAINFLSTYPVTIVGFAESLFSVEALLNLGGLDERFAVGDTYIKRKFSCYFPVLLVNAGFTFWRQYPSQASNRVRSLFKQLIETYQIDREILFSDYIPLTEPNLSIARKNFKIRSIKLVVHNTLRKGKFLDLFRLMKNMEIPFCDLFLLLIKGNYSYNASTNSEMPLINDYNFN